jgi:hypothetical protein
MRRIRVDVRQPAPQVKGQLLTRVVIAAQPLMRIRRRTRSGYLAAAAAATTAPSEKPTMSKRLVSHHTGRATPAPPTHPGSNSSC